MLTPTLATLPPVVLPLIIIVALVVVVFGVRKIANMGGMDELRKAQDEFARHLNKTLENLYWNQYDAGGPDVTERWKRSPEKGKRVKTQWGRRSNLNRRRARMVIVPCV